MVRVSAAAHTSFWRRPRWWLGLTVLVVAAWLLSATVVAYGLTRRGAPVGQQALPRMAEHVVQDVRLTTSDGEQLGAWFVDVPGDGASVLLLHGKGGSRAQCVAHGRLALEAGHAVLLVTLRAHGDSSGETSDFGWSARHDVVAAVEFLESRRPGRAVVVRGTSMGAAAAAFAAEELGTRVHGYSLECMYADLRTAVRNRTSRYLPPVLDDIAYAGLVVVSPLFVPELDRLDTVRAVQSIPAGVPVLVMGGVQDRLTRPAECRAVAEAVGPHARLVMVPGAGHEGLYAAAHALYRTELLALVQRAREHYAHLTAETPAGR